MKFYFLLILCICSSYFSAQKESFVDIIIKREMAERKIPGLQVAVIQNGKIILKKSFGTSNIQNNILVSDTTIFPINSCTKVFTGTAVMQLVEEGKIDLSAPVSKYLSDLPKQWQPVTIEQMMVHISGFPDIVRLFDPVTGGALKPEKEIWEELKALPMDFKTGEQMRYNQTNYYLLGKIIEKVSGEPFDLFFKHKQFQPVGMKNTVFGDSRDVIPYFAPTYGYRSSIDDRKLNEEKLINDYHIFPDYSRTAAGLNTSAEDLAKWIISLQKQQLFKSKSTLTKMWSPSKMNNGTPTSWALGWGLTKFRTKHKAVGMSGGGRSAFLVYPDDNLSVIVLTNLMGSSPEDFLEELAGVYNPEIIKADPITYLRINLKKQGFSKAIEVVNLEKKNNPEFNPGESELNDWAYRMMSRNQIKEAYEILKLNVHLFPDSWNVYDSYGDVLLKMGNKNEGIKMYKRSIELNPDNEYGKNILKQLNE
ncbi:CubicO group peptidase (beta-lactamase class C family) [Chryseobacterium sp. H1D6B]|uniref:serine hydrolase n=1 Tax=Chryseobacterium sp. H1D6B TaxID=2940588 RepID=UPI0015C8236E|nr:serine hydrolase [Chryseobacterium sp. H1D6B]MDH6253362.1 CubicO group peptidase (beta-lactamase class C family) [Chryseobacterium sp. H1D6B]